MLTVVIPAAGEEARFGFPAHRECFLGGAGAAVGQHPCEVDALVEALRLLTEGRRVQPFSSNQRAHHQKSRVDGRHLAVPLALARFPVDEVIEPAALMGQRQVGFERLLGAFDRLRFVYPAASDGNWQHRKREAARGNTRDYKLVRFVIVRAVFDKPRVRVRLVPEIVKRATG
jgi:hypothetical protein